MMRDPLQVAGEKTEKVRVQVLCYYLAHPFYMAQVLIAKTIDSRKSPRV